jgi:asparagine N-glycosylation enzyme membrane subunit Stt3
VDLKRVFLRVLIASLLATAGLAIGFLLLADFNERTWKVIASTALLSAFSLLGLPGAALLDQGRALPLGWANVVLAAVGLAWTLALLWSESERGWQALVAVVALTAATAQASGTTARRRADDPQSVDLVYLAGLGGAFLLAALISLAAWQKIEDDGFYRIVGALAVAEVVAVILQPILRRTSKRAPAPTGEGEARFVCTFDDGREADCTDAMSAVISKLESSGTRVVKIERR